MIVVASDTHLQHNPPHEFLDGALVPIFETPARVAIIRAALERAAIGPVVAPRSFGIEPVRAVHDDGYLTYLETIYDRWVVAGGAPEAVIPGTLAVRWMTRPHTHPLAAPGYYTFDTCAPIVAGTYAAARAAADIALTGAERLLAGERCVYALCRPPGHHAGRDLCGGYCFLNNAAIAAEYLIRNAAGATCAILDIDVHHGNGTQQIFYERNDVLFVSIHASPDYQYPFFLGYADERGAGAGEGYNLNLPLAAGVGDREYLAALDQALRAIVDFAPRFLVLSAGFDTFAGDPVAGHGGGFALSASAYPQIGRHIAALNLPTLVVQEGGYAIEALGDNVVGLLQGLEE